MSSIHIQVANPDAPCSCQDCDWQGPASALLMVASVEERITAGEIVPAGECPECGALAHLDEPGRAPAAGDVAIPRSVLQGLINAAQTTAEDWKTGIESGNYEADLIGALDKIESAIAAAEAALGQTATTPEAA